MEFWEYREALLKAIEQSAKCDATYLHTQPVQLAKDGRTIWKGKVLVYDLKGHPQAKNAYGWYITKDGEKPQYITVVGIPPMDSPLAAVKAYMASRT